MLRFMRKFASRWVLGFILAVIIIAFVFGFGFGRGGNKYSIGNVGSYEISPYEYRDLLENMEKTYRAMFKDRFDEMARNELNLKEMALNQMIEKYLMLTKASKLGISVSDKEIEDNLLGVEIFKKNGKFDRETYENFYRRKGMDPRKVDQDMRDYMVIERMKSIILDNGAQVDEKSAYNAYVKEKGQIKLAMTIFDPEDFKSKVSVDDKEIEAIYSREKDTFRSENAFHLTMMAIKEGSGLKDDQAYMDLLKKKDLAEYGKSKGIEVVNLGMIKEGDLLAKYPKLPMRDALKGLSKGDVTLPLRDGPVSYIFQMVERQDGKPLDKTEASKIIRERIAKEKTQMMARSRAEDLLKDKNLKSSKETEFMPRSSGLIAGIGPIPKDNQDLLSIVKGQTYTKVIGIDGKYYVFSYADEKRPDDEDWKKDKENFMRFYTSSTKVAFLNSFTEELKKTIKITVNRDNL
jgi:hypothetical protein